MCGASLIWKYLLPNKQIPLFIKYVEDNDTGTWKYAKTKPFIFALGINYTMTPSFDNLKKWKTLLNKMEVEEVTN